MLKVAGLSLLRPPIFSSHSNVCDRLIRGNLLFIFVVVVFMIVVVVVVVAIVITLRPVSSVGRVPDYHAGGLGF